MLKNIKKIFRQTYNTIHGTAIGTLREEQKMAFRNRDWETVVSCGKQLKKYHARELAQSKLQVEGLIQMGRHAEAGELLSRLLKYHKNQYQLHEQYLMLLEQQGKTEEFIVVARNLQAEMPQYTKGLWWEAKAYLQRKQYDKAQNVYQNTIRQYPKQPAGYQGLIIVAENQKDWTQMQARAEEMLQHFPKHPYAEKKHAAAVQKQKLCKELKENMVYAYLAQDYQLMNKNIKRLKNELGERFSYSLIAADTAFRLGQYEEAEKIYSTQLNTPNPDIYERLITIALCRQDKEKALQYAQAFAAVLPDSAVAQKYLGDAYLALSHYADAQNVFNTLTKKYPQDPRGYQGLLRLAEARQDWSALQAAADAYKSMRPGDFDAQLQYAKALHKNQQSDTALKLLVDLHTEYPERLESVTEAAVITVALGETDISLNLLQQASFLQPLQTEKNIPAVKHSVASNTTEPLVSIVMPVFNVAPYLDAGIMSVLNQTYKNIEVIIVNDASTDSGMNIIRMYAARDKRIKVIDLEFNTLGGAGIPSNIGIKAAKGKYIAFADSDDIIDAEALEKMVTAAENFGSDLVIADFCLFNDESRLVTPAADKQHWNNLPVNKPFTAKEQPGIFRLSPVPWRKLYRRSYAEKYSVRFPEGDWFYEDNPLHWYALTSAAKIVLIDHPAAYHRLAREGQTMSADSFKFASQFCHLNSIKNHLLNSGQTAKIYWKELADFAYRGNWVVEKQDNPDHKAIVQKRYAQTALDIFQTAHEQGQVSKADITKMRPQFFKRCEEYQAAYPDFELCVVVPVYNCADLLPQLLDQLVELKSKTQIYLVDDGSDDGSAEICTKYAEKYPYIYAFKQKNKGAGVARNTVIPLITAEYVYFVDADDTINPQALDNAVKQAKAQNNDLVFFPYKIDFHDKGKVQGMWNNDQNHWDKLRNAKTNNEKKQIAAQLTNYPWIRIVKTSLLLDANIFFGKTIVHNDVPYHWHSIIAAKNIGTYQEAVCSHRKFDERQQITNITDVRRLMVLEAYRYTNSLLKQDKNYILLHEYWKIFITKLLKWAAERIPEDKQEFYAKRHQEILKELKRQDEISV